MNDALSRNIVAGVALVLASAVAACGGNSSSWTPLLVSTEPPVVTFGATDLTVNGARFEKGAVVFWNGHARPTTFLDPETLRATLDPAATQVVGEAVVTVANPGSFPSMALKVTVSIPQLESISPISVPAGYPEFTLTLTGTGFSSAAQVTWNGTALQTQLVSSTTLTAQVPAALVGALGSSVVAVVTPVPCAPQSAPPCTLTSAEARFTVGGTEPGLGLKIVRQRASDLEWDSAHGLLFLSAPEPSSGLPQTISALDPVQGAITKSVPQDDPGLLALSDDGKYLYVAARSFTPIRISRFDLPSLTRTSWSFDSTSAGARSGMSLDDLQVAPGSSDTLAISFDDRVVILDDAVLRPNSLSKDFWEARSLQWGFDASRLFAAGDSVDMLLLAVDSAGLVMSGRRTLTHGRIHYDRITRSIYDDGGAILDESGLEKGAFNVYLSIGCVAAPDGALGKVFFGCKEDTQVEGVSRLTLRAFDITSFQMIDRVVVNGTATTVEDPNRLVRWGTNGLALATSTTLYLYSGLLVH